MLEAYCFHEWLAIARNPSCIQHLVFYYCNLLCHTLSEDSIVFLCQYQCCPVTKTSHPAGTPLKLSVMVSRLEIIVRTVIKLSDTNLIFVDSTLLVVILVPGNTSGLHLCQIQVAYSRPINSYEMPIHGSVLFSQRGSYSRYHIECRWTGLPRFLAS